MSLPTPLLTFIDELDRLGRERDDAWQIPRVEGELLRQIALSHHAKLIVEIGTSYGFSGLFWASALRTTGGMLHTVDKDPRKFELSKATFAKAGVGSLITNHLGDGQHVIPKLPGAIDLAFIDADKPATQAYIDLLWPKLRVGGSLLIDNATTHKPQLAPVAAALRAKPDASVAEVAVGNGLEWAIKLH
jgi:predicted O-methyltransferase YrrM